jgi:allantoinase
MVSNVSICIAADCARIARMDTAIRAQRVVTPEGERAAVLVVRGGVIAAVTDRVPDEARLVDVPHDQVVLPGLVDIHVHVNEPGRTEWEGFATATAAAAAGGVTTIVDMPLNSIPPTVDVAALEQKKAAAAGQLSVDVAFWGGAVPGNADQLRMLHDAGVVGFKCFLLPSGVAEFPPLDRAGLHQAMTAIADFDGLLIAHAEDERHIGAAHGRSYGDFLASRPEQAEVAAIEMLVDETRRTGCRTHIVHLSSAAALPVIAAAKADGLPLTVETCPHYLSFAAEQIPDGATEYKCCPPIRDAANRDALWAALFDETIDLVASDHSPCPAADKRRDFGDAWGGIASVQLGLPAIWTAGRPRGATLTQLARWMATAPARLVRLPHRGAIAAGMRADLAIVAADETFVVDPARLRHRHPVTPYAGSTLHGVVHETWLGGVPIRDEERRGRTL